MGLIDQSQCRARTGTIYPEPYASQVAGRSYMRLGDAAGLTQFGANLVILAPGGRSSLRHWHHAEDEFVMVTEGELVLVQDEGEYVMHPGDCAAWPAGDRNGHCFLNRTAREARFLVVGSKSAHEVVTYSDEDLMIEVNDGQPALLYRDGTPWAGPR
jgi:uncharacterized cupin superfamily protein